MGRPFHPSLGGAGAVAARKPAGAVCHHLVPHPANSATTLAIASMMGRAGRQQRGGNAPAGHQRFLRRHPADGHRAPYAGQGFCIYTQHSHARLAAGIDDRRSLCGCIRDPDLVLDRGPLVRADGHLWLLLVRCDENGEPLPRGGTACHHRTFLTSMRSGMILGQTETKFCEILLQIPEDDPAFLELLTRIARCTRTAAQIRSRPPDPRSGGTQAGELALLPESVPAGTRTRIQFIGSGKKGASILFALLQ